MAIEISRYCIPWTPFRKTLEEATVMLVSTAAVHHKDDPPFIVDGDLSFRAIDGATPTSDLRIADAHYDHACVDADINTVFPLDRLHELARDERRIAAVAEMHFSTGFTQDLRRFRDETVPAVMAEIVKQRPDCVLFTGGWRLCHRTVSAIQRAVEMQAIPTVQITVEPEETTQARVPRALCPHGYKNGCTFGRPAAPSLHKRIILDALDLLVHPAAPGELITREYT